METLPVTDLRAALAARGRLKDAADPAPVDTLLPLYSESAGTWELRRAATEVAIEPDLRAVRFRELLLPESAPTADPENVTELIDSPAGRAAFGAIQAITPFDAESAWRDDIAARGRSGALLSRVSFSIDSDQADATAELWVRHNDDRWTLAFAAHRDGAHRRARRSERAADRLRRRRGARGGPGLGNGGLDAVPSGSQRAAAGGRQRRPARPRAARAALNRDLAPLLLPVVPAGRR